MHSLVKVPNGQTLRAAAKQRSQTFLPITIVASGSAALSTRSEAPARPDMVTAGEIAAQKSDEKYGLVESQTRSTASAVDRSLRFLNDVKIKVSISYLSIRSFRERKEEEEKRGQHTHPGRCTWFRRPSLRFCS